MVLFSPVFLSLVVITGCGQSEPAAVDVPSHDVSKDSSGSGPSGSSVLPEDVRKRIWDIEHLGFVIEATVFPKLKSSIKDGSLSFWKTMLGEDCTVSIPVTKERGRKSLAGGTATFSSDEFSPEDMTTGTRESFLVWLAAQRNVFEECSSSLGLVRLTPEGDDFSGGWTSVWRLRIWGSNSTGPVETEIELSVRLRALDDDIADHSGQLAAVTVLNEQHLAASQACFKETTETCGLVSATRYDNWTQKPFIPNTGGIYVTDYDRDGHLDVFVDDQADGNRLYRGTGDGQFQDVTLESGIDRGSNHRAWALSCWVDLDNDGDDDLICEDKLYENLGDGHFRDITAQSNIPLTPAVGYAVADYDSDGLPDLYVCHTSAYRVGQSELSRVKWVDGGLGIDNVLLKNLGNWQFEDVTTRANAGAGGSSCFAAVWLHASRDNLPDVFAINEFGANSLLVGTNSGRFEERDIDPIFGGFSMGVTAGDYNNDGRTDLYVANMYSKAGNRILANVDRTRYPDELYRKLEEGTRGSRLYAASDDETYRIVPERDMFSNVGWAYGATFVDLDNDGWLDLYATAGFKSEERGKPDG